MVAQRFYNALGHFDGEVIMSQTLQTLVPYESEYQLDRQENTEIGWYEVGRGLRLILFGYFMWFVIIALAVWVLFAAMDVTKQLRNANPKIKWGEIIGMFGIFILGLVALWSYWLVILGQWRCLNAPERSGAKWFIFVCMTCIILVPILDIASSFLGAGDNFRHIQKGVEGMGKISFKGTGGFMQMLSGILGFVSYMCFLFFLRAIARCFKDPWRTMNVNLCILFNIVLTAGTVYFTLTMTDVFSKPELFRKAFKGDLNVIKRELLLLVGIVVGSVLSFFWYLWLIASMRRCILTNTRYKPAAV
jgi:hypothetical protein